MEKNSKILIAGRYGLVGSAIERSLKKQGYKNIIGENSTKIDFLDKKNTINYVLLEKPEYVFIAAAKVGGISDNMNNQAQYLYQNLNISFNLLKACIHTKPKKILYLGSSCCYPYDCKQPMKEEYLHTGELEPTNEGYALAKLTSIKFGEFLHIEDGLNFTSAMPCNIYGIGDNFNLETSHVIPALIQKIHLAKENNDPYVTIWGTGESKREFMFSDDLGDACVFLMKNYIDNTPINIGSGVDVTIMELAILIKDMIGYEGKIHTDPNRPDGMKQKLLDITKIKTLGWTEKIDLIDGLKLVYDNFLKTGIS